MPYADPQVTPNKLRTVVTEQLASHPADAMVRIPIVGTPQVRCIVVRWPVGHIEPPHRHPRAVELFLIISGRVRAGLGYASAVEGTPGTILFSAADEEHSFEVLGTEPLVMVAIVAPNEDIPGETLP